MYFATGLDPTNETARTRGSLKSASTASLAPCTTFMTPAGSPASYSNSDARTLQHRRLAPGGECLLRRRYRCRNLLVGAVGNQRHSLARSGIGLHRGLAVRPVMLAADNDRHFLQIRRNCARNHGLPPALA